MNRLQRYLLASFLPSFLGGILFFIMILELAELLPNLAKFINYDVKILDIAKLVVLYLPKCISYSLPIALLFAVSFTLGSMYAKNELVAIFNSGVSLYVFTLPLVLVSMLLSLSSFFFEDHIVIDALKHKNIIFKRIMKQTVAENNTDITVMSKNGKIVYQVGFFNEAEKSLQGVVVVERAENGTFSSRLNAERALWNGTQWEFSTVKRYFWKADGSSMLDESLSNYKQENLDEVPETFRKTGKGIEEMKVSDARIYVDQLKNAGFPFEGELAEYHARFSFSLTPLIVILLSVTMGGRFRKNILLMSGLFSLIGAAGYYVFDMITMLFAKLGYLDPFIGAWLPFAFFVSISVVLYRHAKT